MTCFRPQKGFSYNKKAHISCQIWLNLLVDDCQNNNNNNTGMGPWHHQWSLVIHNVDTYQVQCLNYYVHTQAVSPANRKALTLQCILPRCPAATECEGPRQHRRKTSPAPVLPESKRKSAAHGRRRARSSTRR